MYITLLIIILNSPPVITYFSNFDLCEDARKKIETDFAHHPGTALLSSGCYYAGGNK